MDQLPVKPLAPSGNYHGVDSGVSMSGGFMYKVYFIEQKIKGNTAFSGRKINSVITRG